MARLRKRLHCWWYGHDREPLQINLPVARVRCNRCGDEWLHDVWSGRFIPWFPEAEEFFARRGDVGIAISGHHDIAVENCTFHNSEED